MNYSSTVSVGRMSRPFKAFFFAFGLLALVMTPVRPAVAALSMVRGQADAPVRIELFVDLACPASARAFRLAMELTDQYGAQKVRLIVHPLAQFGAPSEFYHRALAAAARQGKGIEFAADLFQTQRVWQREVPFSAFDEALAFDKVIGPLATRLQLDLEQLKTDMADQATRSVLEEEAKLGRERSVRMPPACFINDRPVARVLDQALWRQMIDAPPAVAE